MLDRLILHWQRTYEASPDEAAVAGASVSREVAFRLVEQLSEPAWSVALVDAPFDALDFLGRGARDAELWSATERTVGGDRLEAAWGAATAVLDALQYRRSRAWNARQLLWFLDALGRPEAARHLPPSRWNRCWQRFAFLTLSDTPQFRSLVETVNVRPGSDWLDSAAGSVAGTFQALGEAEGLQASHAAALGISRDCVRAHFTLFQSLFRDPAGTPLDGAANAPTPLAFDFCGLDLSDALTTLTRAWDADPAEVRSLTVKALQHYVLARGGATAGLPSSPSLVVADDAVPIGPEVPAAPHKLGAERWIDALILAFGASSEHLLALTSSLPLAERDRFMTILVHSCFRERDALVEVWSREPERAVRPFWMERLARWATAPLLPAWR